MTASEGHATRTPPATSLGEPDRSLGDLAMDVLVYAPAGALLTVLDDLPGLATKGRVRLDQELRNAQVVGRFAVQVGWRGLRRQVESLAGGDGGDGGAGALEVATSTPSTDRPAEAVPDGLLSPRRARGAGAAPGRTYGRDPAVDQAIPEYDTLSASQVVRRLDGLRADELREVVHHELAGRGRRTIVHRARQLLGTDEPPPLPTAP